MTTKKNVSKKKVSKKKVTRKKATKNSAPNKANSPSVANSNSKMDDSKVPVGETSMQLEQQAIENQSNAEVVSVSNTLSLELSESLFKKLKNKAEIEGVSHIDLARELISEGVMLRAFEIVERNNVMKNNAAGNGYGDNGYRSNGGYGNGYSNNYDNNRRRNGGGSGNRRHNNNRNYQKNAQMMEDKASFMEFLRNQERSNGKKY